ncbi:MAG: polysulfide reductase NrfD [Kofleriaceae bacterium]|nr:polysulfide reductase NrfD [Kofleriaceae bacterium]
MVLVAIGVDAYADQFRDGLIRTNMRDPVSWGFYIGNFAFLVGVAAAAVVLVIPAYLYDWKPIKEIALIGELLAIAAIIMCVLFVTVDVGNPLRVWHMLPFIGTPNFPRSLLAWDVVVLSAYLTLNLVISTHILFKSYRNQHYNKRFAVPLILFSIPAAVGIHTVTAFLFAGLPARSYWNAAILAPRFLTSAFCSGPAIILVLLQILRRTTRLKVTNAALFKIAELMAYAMFINLFLFGAEIFRDYYSSTREIIHYQFLFGGGPYGGSPIAIYAWFALACSLGAFLLFLIPRTRTNLITLNIGAVMIYAGVYIEKGVALVVPGFAPSTLGEIYQYAPSSTELRVSMGIFGIGAILFTLMVKVATKFLFSNPALQGHHDDGGHDAPGAVAAAAVVEAAAATSAVKAAAAGPAAAAAPVEPEPGPEPEAAAGDDDGTSERPAG